MTPVRNRVRDLITYLSLETDRLADEDLESLERTLTPLYYDLYMLRAIGDARNTLNPGDTLTREEAMEFLQFL